MPTSLAPTSDSPTPRELLTELYTVATGAVDPGPALARRLRELPLRAPVRILALGKAAGPMARAAVAVLSERASAPVGGLVVAPAPERDIHPALPAVAGDHPEPGPGSRAAAEALGRAAASVHPGDEVWVLLSGGTTSLVGAPDDGVDPADLATLYTLLLGSGLDITAMNRVRKRFSRWGGGKLAVALAPARVRAFVVSDVIGDDLASIGSGPLVPDPGTAADVRRLLEDSGLWHRIPATLAHRLAAVESGAMPETPKPGDEAFARVGLELIASNRLAVDAAAKRAAELGLDPVVSEAPLAGEASAVGASVAAALLQDCAPRTIPQPEAGSRPPEVGARHQPEAGSRPPEAGARHQPEAAARRRCYIWGGETTVTLGDQSGLGGRCQELALAAARTLVGAPAGVALLAAGTDGRDGPTDAAGAIVDARTWQAVSRAGRDPARDLAAHDAYPALDAAGALLRPGLTGTNVMDVVIGLGPA